MKIDRLLSIIMYLMNRHLVSARELAKEFNVSQRTIQRDMEAIGLSGIPIVTIQGPNGGYGIMDTYKLDRKLVTMDELYFIITALAGMQSTLADPRIRGTLEKMKGLLPPERNGSFHESRGKLSLDFSMLGGPKLKPVLSVIEKALEADRLLKITYTNNKIEIAERIVEPMTLVFKWRSWYLYAYCRLKQDYRIFRVERITDPELLAGRFTRRKKSAEEFFEESGYSVWGATERVTLKFDSRMKAFVLPFNPDDVVETHDDGSILLTTSLPTDGSHYGYILSFGKFVEVIAPVHLRAEINEAAADIIKIYEKN